jgi:hypothetical protein
MAGVKRDSGVRLEENRSFSRENIQCYRLIAGPDLRRQVAG